MKTTKRFLILVTLLAVLTMTFTSCSLLIGSMLASDTEDADEVGGELTDSDPSRIGDYGVEILRCRLAKDFTGENIVIVTYSFTNYGDDAISFGGALNDDVYQNGVELSKCYMVDDNEDYSSDNQYKDIKKGVTLEVEVAYTLNDTTGNIEVEVSEFLSWNDKMVTKTFKLKET